MIRRLITHKSLFYRFLALFLAFWLVNPVAATTLPPESVIDRFDENGIYYYLPESDHQVNCNTTSTTLAGDSTAEQVWNFFSAKGFSDAQVAGIVGNAQVESGFSPTRSSNGSFWGIFQWGGGRLARLKEKVRAAGLGQYLDSQYFTASADKKIPPADHDKLVQLELEFAYSEKDFNWQNELKKSDNPELSAEIFLTLFERAVGGKDPILHYQPYKNRLYQAAKKRRNSAVDHFKKFSGHGVKVEQGNQVTSESGKNISIIGDSITVGSSAELQAELKDLQASDIDARVSRPWSEGVDILRSKKDQLKKTVIFALGTNSARLSQKDLDEVVSLLGSEHNIIFVTNYAHSPDAYAGNNALFKNYAKNHANISVADWHAVVSKDPGAYLAKDQIHPNAAGRKLFAKTVASAVNGNLDADGCQVNGNFSQLVTDYAWPDWHDAPWHERRPAYAEAIKQAAANNGYIGGSVAGVPGIDCGAFVTNLMRNSGIAPNYNAQRGNTVAQEAWVKSQGWTLLNSSPTTAVDTSILQPGDVAFSNGHTFVYVGEIAGFNSRIASASYQINGAGRAPMAGKEDLIFGNGVTVRWYRNPSYNAHENVNTKSPQKEQN